MSESREDDGEVYGATINFSNVVVDHVEDVGVNMREL